jgi:long-chain fatty acid transport protein
MRVASRRTAWSAGAALGLLTIGIGEAAAGGFAVREQSAYGQGLSFAGMAAGGALSSMFWNPATMTQLPGINIEAVAAGIFPYTANTPAAGSTLIGLGGTANTSDDALVPSGYASWQVSPNLWVGLSVNAPYGLSVSFPDLWAGRNYAGNSSLRTYNATPSIAVKINDWLSFGAGLQVQYASASLTNGLTVGFPFGTTSLLFGGHGWSVGATAGITITPWPSTVIGLGWRSRLDQDISGTLQTPLPGGTTGPAKTTLKLPDTISLGIRHNFNGPWTVMATAEWTTWSRIGTATSGALVANFPPFIPPTPLQVAFEYKDGWFFSLGGEYAWSDRLTVRAGVGYEISPITDTVRTPRLPDNDRIWTSVGLSYKVFDSLSFDIGYTHLFVADTPINITATSGNPSFNPSAPFAYVGSVDSHADIVSFGLRYRFLPPTPEPVLIRKG